MNETLEQVERWLLALDYLLDDGRSPWLSLNVNRQVDGRYIARAYKFGNGMNGVQAVGDSAIAAICELSEEVKRTKKFGMSEPSEKWQCNCGGEE